MESKQNTNQNFSAFNIDELLEAYIMLEKTGIGGEVVKFTFLEAKNKIRAELENRDTKELVQWMINESM
jgi:hypothetical protein